MSLVLISLQIENVDKSVAKFLQLRESNNSPGQCEESVLYTLVYLRAGLDELDP